LVFIQPTRFYTHFISLGSLGKEVIKIPDFEKYPDVHVHLHTVEDDDFRRVLHNFNNRLKALESAEDHDDTSQFEARLSALETKATTLTNKTTALEVSVTTANERITALTSAVTEYNEDVAAKLSQLRSDIDALTAAGSENAAELAAVNSSLGALESAVSTGVAVVGDADADGTPAAPVVEEPPVEEEPVEEPAPIEEPTL